MEETTREKVLASFSNIPWDDFARTQGFLSHQDVDTLRRMHDQSLDVILGDQDEGRAVAQALLKVLSKSTRDITVQQFALTRIDDILSGNVDIAPSQQRGLSASELAKRALYFGEPDCSMDDAPFIRALRGNDLYSKRVAATALSRLIVANTAPMDNIINCMCETLQNSRASSEAMRYSVNALTILLTRNDARHLFGQHGGVGYLTKLLKDQGVGANAQLLYELTFCLWTISFCEEIVSDFIKQGTVSVLVEQVTAAPREKVVRVSLATLRNISQEDDEIITQIISCGLLKALKNMRDRQWADPDIAEDVDALYTTLMRNYRELSTYDKWVGEVSSGQLKWGSLVHEEKFWRENARELEANDFEMLKALIKHVISEETEVASVALYDLGEFVRFYPNGKSIAKNLGAKDLVMGRIKDEDPDVQRYALQCMSKIMINHWEFLR